METTWAGPEAGGESAAFSGRSVWRAVGAGNWQSRQSSGLCRSSGLEQGYLGRAEPAPAASRAVSHCPKLPLQPPLLTLHLPPAFPSALHAKCRDVRASAVGGCGATAEQGVALNR